MHKSSRPFRLLAALIAVALAAALMVVGASEAGAVPTGTHANRVVSDDPANNTPRVMDGWCQLVRAGRRRHGGRGQLHHGHDRRRPEHRTSPGATCSRSTSPPATLTSLAPALNGEVTDVESTGDGQSVWIAGGFSNLNSQTVRSLAVNINTGQRVTSFNPPAFDGRIHDMELRNGELYVMGRFMNVGNRPRPLLAAVDRDDRCAGHLGRCHLLRPPPQRRALDLSADLSPDGTKLVAIGNFTKVNGLDRYQIAVLDIAPTGTNRVSVATGRPASTATAVPLRSSRTCVTSTSHRTASTSWSPPPVPTTRRSCATPSLVGTSAAPDRT